MVFEKSLVKVLLYRLVATGYYRECSRGQRHHLVKTVAVLFGPDQKFVDGGDC